MANKNMNQIKVTVNANIYSREAIIKVVDLISNEYITVISEGHINNYLLIIRSKYKNDLDPVYVEGLIFDHLNNQSLRKKIYRETHRIREYIVGKALFETEAFDNNSEYFDINHYEDEDNYILDPYHIAIPYGVKTKKNKVS